MAIVSAAPRNSFPVYCQTPILAGARYAVNCNGATYIVDGSNVGSTVEAIQQAFLNQQAQKYQQSEIIVQQSSNQKETFSLASFFGLIGGAFLAIVALRSPHMQEGIRNIRESVMENMGGFMRQSSRGLNTLRTYFELPKASTRSNQNKQEEPVPATV